MYSGDCWSTFGRFIWATSSMFFGVYSIVQNINIPLIVQPQVFGFLCAVAWVQVWGTALYQSTLIHHHSVSFLRVQDTDFAVYNGSLSIYSSHVQFRNRPRLRTAGSISSSSSRNSTRAAILWDHVCHSDFSGTVVSDIIDACHIVHLHRVRPQYVEIYRIKEVRGISFVFMAIDIGGGVFSLLSLAFKPKWDVVASVSILWLLLSAS